MNIARKSAENAKRSAHDRDARRAHRRLARVRIASLRAKMKAAIAARNAKMKEIVATCREQRRAVRVQIKTMWNDGRRAIRERAEAERQRVRDECDVEKDRAKQACDSAIDLVRAELAAEKKRAAEERRIGREERTRHQALTRSHVTGAAHTFVVRAAMLGALGPLFERVRPAPGQSRPEAILHYAETHPEQVHAVLHPGADRAIAETKAEMAAAVRAMGAPTTRDLERALRSRKRSATTEVSRPKASEPKATRAAGRVEPPAAASWTGDGYDDRILCSRCGCKGGQHRGSDGKCPKTAAWGRPAPDPMSNHALDKTALDAALAAYWSANATFYRPVTARGKDDAAVPAERPPNAYEQKKAARVDRMRARADKKKAEAAGAFMRADSIASVIPAGQPILVGHHSEKRHRRDIARIDQGFRKSFELTREAEQLARRADFAERNDAISSDDPNAVDKLLAKLAELNTKRARWKLVNEAVRAAKNEGDLRASLARLGVNENLACDLLTPDFAGRMGIADYQFKNAGSEARRLEQRIKQLETAAKAPEKPAETIGHARIYEADSRVRVEFPTIPPEGVRKKLKGAGFHWSPTVGAWQRHASSGAWYHAREIAAAMT